MRCPNAPQRFMHGDRNDKSTSQITYPMDQSTSRSPSQQLRKQEQKIAKKMSHRPLLDASSPPPSSAVALKNNDNNLNNVVDDLISSSSSSLSKCLAECESLKAQRDQLLGRLRALQLELDKPAAQFSLGTLGTLLSSKPSSAERSSLALEL